MKTEFHVGDRVRFLTRGLGTIIEIDISNVDPYPIRVKWDDIGEVSTFTEDGYVCVSHTDDEPKLVVVQTEEEKFKVGDHVVSRHYGRGVVFRILDPTKFDYPVGVHWINEESNYVYAYEYYTLDGQFHTQYPDPEYDIIHDIDPKDAEKVLPNILHELGDDDEEGNKKVEDAINPSHYKVDGLPEAIDIMNHLMTTDQFEGFLWGNIMKYAYRFGRKGDKGETAGKIAWYANQLKAVEEWRNENET